jgi:flagellar basal body-associated protein FliL
VRDEQNKNRQTEEDRFIEAYLNRIDADAPDLWDRIEAGLDREAKDAEEKQKKTSKVKYVIPVLAIAAVLLAAVIATPLLSDSKRHSKEINAGRTTDVSNDGLDAAENSNISDRAEDYVDETADSIPETVQNETANRPTQNTTEDIQMNGAGGDSSDVQAEAGHTKSQTDAQENAGCTDSFPEADGV